MTRSILATVLATTAFAFAFAARPAAADDAAIHASPSAPSEGANSINLNPLAIMWGDYGANYEHLFSGGHGLVVEANYSRGAADDGSTYVQYGGAVGYRYHWRGRQNSGFLGAMLGFGVGSGLATVDDGSGPMSFDMSIRTLYATVDIGKRWQLGDHLNITFRVGAGRAVRSVTSDSNDPKAQTAVADVQSLLDWLPVTLDGELSLGYTF